MQKLYIAMVGLPARGKSTLARRICQGLLSEGVKVKIFNNGDLRRKLVGALSTQASFYDPNNEQNTATREQISLQNMKLAREWLAYDGEVAILDATNTTLHRRELIIHTLTDYPVLFVECVNEDPLLQEMCVRSKASMPDYAEYTKEAALKSFEQRVRFYESSYLPLKDEKYWLRVDAAANRVLEEHPLESSPFYPAIREIVTNYWVQCLYLARHGQTVFNVEGRIGGDPQLTAKGRKQAEALAQHLKNQPIEWVFTSTRRRSHETAAPTLQNRTNVKVLALQEFDELWAGDCEGLRYADIREKMPEIANARNADKFNFAYPKGESYALLYKRVQRGLRRALFLAGGSTLLIVGHQAINRVILSLFLRCSHNDIPYMYVPQNEYYHISLSPRCKLFERVPFLAQ